jgi:HEAT repeat protein
MAGVDAFGLLKDELKSEDIQHQVNAARRVNTIALGMGEERARGELIPFLRQKLDEYTDEILLVRPARPLDLVLKPPIPPLVAGTSCTRSSPIPIVACVASAYLRLEQVACRQSCFESSDHIGTGVGAVLVRFHSVSHKWASVPLHVLALAHAAQTRRWQAIAEAAGGLVKAIGGGEHAHVLIPLLEALAEKEETIVRQKAVESLVQVGKQMPASTLQSEMKEVVKRMASGDFFPSRISAAGLFATVYPSTPPAMRPQLRKMYEQLAKDEMPMVRSAAFAHMPALAAVVEREVLTGELSPLFNELSQDMQESVRELAVDNMEEMVGLLSPEEASRIFGAFFDNVQMEKCSSMRVNKAKHFVKLAEAMDPARPLKDQVPAYLMLLAQDPEVEVRNAAAANLGLFCSKLDSATVKGQILPTMKDLAQQEDQPAAQGGANPNQQVRGRTCAVSIVCCTSKACMSVELTCCSRALLDCHV